MTACGARASPPPSFGAALTWVLVKMLFCENFRVYRNMKHLTGCALLYFMHMTKVLLFVSVSDHPFFVGVQYHPEFLSRPIKPSPPYFGLLLASVGRLPHYLQKGCRLSPRCGHSSLVRRGAPRLIAVGMRSFLGSPQAACVPPGPSPVRGLSPHCST